MFYYLLNMKLSDETKGNLVLGVIILSVIIGTIVLL